MVSSMVFLAAFQPRAFPGWPVQLEPLSLSVSCHIGPGARAITLAKAVRPD